MYTINSQTSRAIVLAMCVLPFLQELQSAKSIAQTKKENYIEIKQFQQTENACKIKASIQHMTLDFLINKKVPSYVLQHLLPIIFINCYLSPMTKGSLRIRSKTWYLFYFYADLVFYRMRAMQKHLNTDRQQQTKFRTDDAQTFAVQN